MDIKQAMQYMNKISCLGSVPGLKMTETLCKRLGNPQDELKFIHIAGTNGKGSTMTYLSSILECSGYKVGRYSSPAVFSYLEKFQINGININEDIFLELLEDVKSAAEKMEEEGFGHPTVFEMETALAFLYFKGHKCDIVLLETGMGGTLDATNIVKTTMVAVITKVSMDHMNFLGHTIDKIAENKAGIIKKGCYVVSSPQVDAVQTVISKKAEFENCDISYVKDNKIKTISIEIDRQIFSYDGYEDIEIKMNGLFQLENAALAIQVCKVLVKKNMCVSEKNIREGLLQASWFGRFSVISEDPMFIIDGAHNEDASIKLAQSIKKYFNGRDIIYIMGILKDKETEKIVKNTYQYAKSIITVTPPNNPRAMNNLELTKVISKYHNNVITAKDIEDAIDISYNIAKKDSLIIAFGSLSYLGELTQIVNKKGRYTND